MNVNDKNMGYVWNVGGSSLEGRGWSEGEVIYIPDERELNYDEVEVKRLRKESFAILDRKHVKTVYELLMEDAKFYEVLEEYIKTNKGKASSDIEIADMLEELYRRYRSNNRSIKITNKKKSNTLNTTKKEYNKEKVYKTPSGRVFDVVECATLIVNGRRY